jgi:hypothetical protein
MLKFSFSQEDLDRALADDVLLRHMVQNRWFSLSTRAAPLADEPIQDGANKQPIDWSRWPQCQSKDA